MESRGRQCRARESTMSSQGDYWQLEALFWFGKAAAANQPERMGLASSHQSTEPGSPALPGCGQEAASSCTACALVRLLLGGRVVGVLHDGERQHRQSTQGKEMKDGSLSFQEHHGWGIFLNFPALLSTSW